MAHGGDRYRNQIKVDLSVNLNPLGIPAGVLEGIRESLFKIEYYPDCEVQELSKKLGALLGIKRENILFGNGASELLTAAVHGLIPEKILIPVPSFSGYERAAGSVKQGEKEGKKPQVRYLKMNSELDIAEDILDEISDEYDMLFLTNPNNPTGRYIDHSLLERILDKCEKCRVITLLDECFMELSDDPEKNTCIKKLEKWPHLLLLRAFTKSFAIPGIRLGYLLASDQQLLRRIKEQLPEWNISVLAQEAGIRALDEMEYLRKSRSLIAGERRYLKEELQRLGFRVVGSDTVYLLFRHNLRDIDLYGEMLKKGILIRDCSDYRGMEKGFYRIAVRNHEENARFIEQLKSIL